MSAARPKPQPSLLPLYGALAAAVISGLAFWLLGSRQDSTSEAARAPSNAPSKTDAAKDRVVPTQDPSDAIAHSKTVHSDPAPLKLTDAEWKASNEVLSRLREDLNAIELANATVIYQADNEFVRETFIQIYPPKPEQLAGAWENFMKNLAATKVRDSVAEGIYSRAQGIENYYSGRRDLPFRVMHSFLAKSVKDAQGSFGVRAYEQIPDIRFTEYGSPYLAADSGRGVMEGTDLRKKETWERYGHLFHLMPELSGIQAPSVEKTHHH
jgi:hypothetical protein